MGDGAACSQLWGPGRSGPRSLRRADGREALGLRGLQTGWKQPLLSLPRPGTGCSVSSLMKTLLAGLVDASQWNKDEVTHEAEQFQLLPRDHSPAAGCAHVVSVRTVAGGAPPGP